MPYYYYWGDRYTYHNAGNDTVAFGAGVRAEDLSFTASGNDLTIRYSANDQVTVRNWYDANYTVETIKLSDETAVTISDITVTTTEGADSFNQNTAHRYVVDAKDGNDTIRTGSGADVINGGLGADTVESRGGNDVVHGDDGADTITAGAGEDTVYGDAGNDILYGNENADMLYGGSGDDTLVGDTETNGDDVGYADRLEGGIGNDMLQGGAGDDTYVFNVGDGVDTIYDAEYNYYYYWGDRYTYHNAGNDTVAFGAGVRAEDLSFTASGNDLTIRYSANDQVTVRNWYDANYTVENIKFADGKTELFSSWKIGTEGNDTLTDGSADGRLFGGGGNDILNGGAGNDIMKGGAGDDLYYVDSTADKVYETTTSTSGIDTGGTDTVVSTVSWTLGSFVENLRLEGTGTINGTGNTLNNTIYAGAGNNVLNGGSGTDTLSYSYTASAVTVSLAIAMAQATGGSGSDTVAGFENLTGSNYNDALTGNTGSNILDGGTGADTMNGGAGNDTYIVDDAGDVVTEAASAGTDIVNASITYTLGDNVENLQLTGTAAINGTGNVLNNTLTGNGVANILNGGDGNDTLNGGAGADTMLGGVGNDTYVVDNVGDIVTEAVNEGTDRVNSSVSYTLSDNVDYLQLTGTAAINGTGNALNNVIYAGAGDNVMDGGAGTDGVSYYYANTAVTVDLSAATAQTTGGSGSDTIVNFENLYGSLYNDILRGNSGGNYIDGYSGADTMIGGAGNDSYVVDNIADVVTEAVNEGSDMVSSSITYTLGSNVENLILSGTTVINGTGNTLDNVIYAGAGDNVMDGGTGTDTLSFAYATAGVTVDLSVTTAQATGGSGSDTILNFEKLSGSNYNDTLSGNSANNVLSGGTGADTMIGGTGNDTYYVDNTGDVVMETSTLSTEIDTVSSSVAYTLGDNVENLILSGAAAINGTGNVLNNSMTGNAAANILDGGAGNDTLNGGTGNDTLTGGTGIDYFVFNSALSATTNMDTITDFSAADDTIRLENAILEKLTATGTLNAAYFAASTTGTAVDADDYILYNTTTGALSYDADGSGAGTAIQFAVLGTATYPTITNADFMVI